MFTDFTAATEGGSSLSHVATMRNSRYCDFILNTSLTYFLSIARETS